MERPAALNREDVRDQLQSSVAGDLEEMLTTGVIDGEEYEQVVEWFQTTHGIDVSTEGLPTAVVEGPSAEEVRKEHAKQVAAEADRQKKEEEKQKATNPGNGQPPAPKQDVQQNQQNQKKNKILPTSVNDVMPNNLSNKGRKRWLHKMAQLKQQAEAAGATVDEDQVEDQQEETVVEAPKPEPKKPDPKPQQQKPKPRQQQQQAPKPAPVAKKANEVSEEDMLSGDF